MNRTIEEIDLTGLIDDDLDDEYDFPTVKISSRRPAAMPSIVKTSNNHKSKNQPSLRHNLPMKKKLSHTKSRKAVLSKKRPSKLVSKAVPNMISPNVVECIEILDDDDKSSEGSNNSDRHDVKDIVNDMKGENYQRKVSVSQCSMGENMDVEPCLSRDACETDTFENPQQPLIRDGIINKKDKEDKISTSKCDRDDANWNDMLQRLISYHNQNGIWNVSIKDDKILQRWVWDQRKAYRLYHEGKESVLKMEWIKLLDDVNFDWGSSRATSASSISDYLWFKEYEQFLDFFEANGRSKAHKHEQCYCWQTAQKHQYWNRKQGKKSQMTDERIKLLEEVGFNWNLSAHEIISSVVDLTDSDNDNTPKASKIQHGSAIKSKQNIGVWSRSFTSQASESRFVFASHKHYPPKKQIEMKKKKMFNFMMSEEEAFLEQERLFQKARARTQNVTITIGSKPKQNQQIFSKPIKDVKALPKDHWTWPCVYARLGLPKDSPEVLVKKHFRKLALLYHPDKNRSSADSLSPFLAIKEAFECITNNM